MRSTALLALMLLAAGDTLQSRACDTNTHNPTPDVTPTPPGSQAPVFTTQDGVRFRVEVVVNNLEIPWSLVFAPDGRLFVTERHGRVQIIDTARQTSQLALTLDDVFTDGEAGLLGFALDPSFGSNGLVYLYYTARAPGGRPLNRVVRYRESGNRLAERVVLLDDIPANVIHDGGRLRFGPDGLLYITAGDAATEQLAQDVASLAGKILRINPDGTTPRGNPFSSPVYSYGHRNPQGIDWHPTTGELWESEHGATGNDEINVVDTGVNYGWPRIEGSQTMPAMREPITFYNPAVAPSGASFYRGQRFPQFANNLFVGTLRGTHLLRLRLDPTVPRRIVAQERLLEGQFGRIRDVVSGLDGLLYFCTNNRDGRGSPVMGDDRIARLVPAS
jgi:glucose/arabinose dehydrogenase